MKSLLVFATIAITLSAQQADSPSGTRITPPTINSVSTGLER